MRITKAMLQEKFEMQYRISQKKLLKRRSTLNGDGNYLYALGKLMVLIELLELDADKVTKKMIEDAYHSKKEFD